MTPKLLSVRLAEVLPHTTVVRAYHISTTPTKTDPIFSAGPSQPEETTYCESHFLVIAIPKTNDHEELATFAAEILIFSTPALTTVFVSKADSTGYAALLPSSDSKVSITKSIVQAFIDFLLEPRLTESRVVLSLFARAQDQYLFPGSVDNVEKHVLDDRQLIKWWCRISDAVWRPRAADNADLQVSAHLVIPGLEKIETKAFFPPSSHADPPGAPKWTNDYPVKLLTVDANLPPRCLVPRLPDDPKSRFLADLDLDSISEDGHWRTVKTLEQFWDFMSYRQECSAGRLVGFLWITFIRPTEGVDDERAVKTDAAVPSNPLQKPVLPSPGDSQTQTGGPYPPPSVDQLGDLLRPQTPPPSSPLMAPVIADDDIGTVQPGAEEATHLSAVTATTEQPPPVREVAVRWPTSTRGQIVTDADRYEDIVDVLLHLDFTGKEAAAESTFKWISSVRETTESQGFGVDIRGTMAPIATQSRDTNGTKTDVPATMLTGVRKKRKPDGVPTAATATTSQPPPTVLAPGLVRKKPKIGSST